MNSMKKNKKKILIAVLLLLLVLVPAVSLAQSTPTGGATPQSGLGPPAPACNATITNIKDLFCKIFDIFTSLLPLLFALGVVYFVWGVVTYVIGNDEEAKKRGRDRIIYGIIGFVVLVGLWGLVYIVTNTFGIAGHSAQISNVAIDQTTSGSGSGSCATLPARPKFQDLTCYIVNIIGKSVIPLIFAVAVALFVWGVVQYVINANDEKERTRGRQFMIWGIIALVVMVSVWGLVSIVTHTFNVDSSFLPQVRQ